MKKEYVILEFGGDPNHHADCPIGNSAIAQEFMNQLQRNFMDGSRVVKGISD